MDETEDDLNYDFNYNMVIARSMMGNLPVKQERLLAIQWLKKLSSCGVGIDELRLRNIFAYYLLLSIKDGQLRPPFDTEPPVAPLLSLQHLLPGEEQLEEELAGAAEAEDESSATADAPPFLYDSSPDGGAFLAAQPVPRCGAYCYLAVVARPDPL